jgi:hypothetical protein
MKSYDGDAQMRSSKFLTKDDSYISPLKEGEILRSANKGDINMSPGSKDFYKI